MKKFFAIIAALVCALSLTACDLFGERGGNGDKDIVDERFCTVTFVTNCEQQLEPYYECYKGDPIALYELRRDGEDYTFDGWYEFADFSGTKYTQSYTPTKDVTLYAKFLKHTFPLEKMSAEEATCDFPGHTEYYVCTYCYETFADADAKMPSSEENFTIPATENHPYSEEFSHNGVAHRRYATCARDYLYVDLGLHDTLGKDGSCSVCGGTTAGVTPNLKYELNAQKTAYVVTGMDGECNTDTLRIPAEHEGLPVERIAYSAFKESTDNIGLNRITAVVLPSSITEIGDYAFESVGGRGDFIFEGTMEQWCGVKFGNQTPYGTHTLFVGGKEVSGDIVVPDSTTKISYQFVGVDGIKSLTFGKNLKTVNKFVSYTVPKINYTGTIGDWLDINFGLNANPLDEDNELYIDGKLVTEITVPNGLSKIKQYAFEKYNKLTKVNLSGKVTEIGYYAFAWCKNLASVSGFQNVETVEHSAFYLCEKLSNIDDASSLLKVNRSAFFGCGEIGEAENGIIYLGKCAVSKERNFNGKTVSFRADTVGLAEELFNGSSIEEVTLPGKVRYMGSSVFENCVELEKVTFEVGVRKIGYRAFMNCSSLKTLELGEIENIGGAAFYGCSSLAEFTLPTTCIEIESEAFNNCNALEKVHYIGTEELWARVQVGTSNDSLKSAILYEPPQG